LTGKVLGASKPPSKSQRLPQWAAHLIFGRPGSGTSIVCNVPAKTDIDARQIVGACIVRDADRGKAIVNRIRDHINKAPPRHDLFDLNEAIAEVTEMVRAPIENNRVSVRTCLAPGLNSVWGDRVQLQQVVLNLVLNAVEAMGSVAERARTLTIRTENDATGIRVAVHDSGPGIDPEHLQRVFDPFYTTKDSGLGMGLSICRSIIAAHGGRLWADAGQPRGAVFQFTLPAPQQDS
jgi:signal transduction histidine kinase